MERICENEKCYGCGACYVICPKNAITMKEDVVTGHFRPIINESKCINCGLCVKHCPANHTYKFADNIVTYAAYRTEPDEQNGSSSGGVAAALYELAISKEWSIIGTVINSDFRVKMELSNDKNAIESFKGSKYVQAYTIEALTELKRTLKADKNVLFIGTPCECEAARSVANGNEEKLLTVDLICHGVPSNKILNDYIRIFSQPAARTATINWYRGIMKVKEDIAYGEIKTPTAFIWGNQDLAIGRTAVEKGHEYMKGYYDFYELNAGHWLTEFNEPEVSEIIIKHIQKFPINQ